MTSSNLLELYQMMVLIRDFETEAEKQYKAANIGGYCHLSSGQEAATVGAVTAMTPTDLLITGYRCHGFALARGTPATEVMAELFGKSHGCARGRGGSMHLLDVARGFYGGWGIVAGQMPIATGLALGLKNQQRDDAVLCELGDGAVNMGSWHESLNMAALWSLPVVFLVINNEYGMGTSVSRASAEPELYKRASAYKMYSQRVDGNDLQAMIEASSELLSEARENHRPAVLEAITYRYRGHSVADAGLSYRSKEEIKEHQQHDPIILLKQQLSETHTSEQLQKAETEAAEQVTAAVEFALGDTEPDAQGLAQGMHAPGSEEQFKNMLPGSPFGEYELVFNAGLGK